MIVVDHVGLDVPSDPEVQLEPRRHRPVVLDVHAELRVVRLDPWIAEPDARLERRREVLCGAEPENRIPVEELLRDVAEKVHRHAAFERVLAGEIDARA